MKKAKELMQVTEKIKDKVKEIPVSPIALQLPVCDSVLF